MIQVWYPFPSRRDWMKEQATTGEAIKIPSFWSREKTERSASRNRNINDHIQVYKIIDEMNQSNVGVIKSTNARCFDFSCQSWSSQDAVSSKLGLNSRSSQYVFCGNTISCNLCLNSWSSKSWFSCDSISFYLSSNSWSSKCWLSSNFSFDSWSSESILSCDFSFNSRSP
jgi:hypothetical protein